MKTKNIYLALLALVLSPAFLTAQENYKTISKEETALIHQGSAAYKVAVYQEPATNKKPKNVIFLIGDGMGLAQIHAGLTANHGKLFLHNFSHIGLQTTHSASNYITDSAAAGTALSSGQKTYNGAIGMNTDTISITNIREVFEQQGLATGVVSTSAVTHATPAAFVAHQPERSMYEAIAADYLKTNIDVFIGGGLKHFTERADGRDLTKDLEKKNYKVLRNIEELEKTTKGKVAALLAPEHMPTVLDGRGDMLPLATKTAISLLEADPDGFFLMVEGSQIDWGGHQNNTSYIISEVLDFDKAVGEALAFAASDKQTLVIVTADHETGGMGINSGAFDKAYIKAGYTSGSHTGVMVPVFAFGPGAEQFTGFYDNTDIPAKIKELLR